MTVSADDAVDADLSPSLLKRKDQPVYQNGNRKDDDGDHDDVVENLNQTEEDVQERDGAADDVGVVELDLLIGVHAVLDVLAQGFQPFSSVGRGRGGQRSSVDGEAEVHVVVVHQDAALGVAQDFPGREDGIERKGWVAKWPRFVDAKHGQVFRGHPHPAVHHFVVLNGDLARTVFFRHGSFKNRGFVHHVSKGQRFKDVADAGLGLAGDGGRQNNAPVLAHVFRARPFTGTGDDARSVAFRQFAVESLGTVEAYRSLIRNRWAGVLGFGIVKRHVGPKRV